MAVAPSCGGPEAFPHRYGAGVRVLEEVFGLNVVEAPHLRHPDDWLARHPEARADDINRAFSDPSIRAVIAAIGGEDGIRVLPHLDLAAIRANPKIFLGYSDTTALHFACMKAGLGSFHGPSIMSGFAENGGMTEAAVASVRATLFAPVAPGPLPPADGWAVEHLDWADPANQDRPRRRHPSSGMATLQGEGRHRGRLIGGCAEVLEMLKGTEWWPAPDDWDGAILFYETSEEAPSPEQVRRWMRGFAAQGILHRVSGLVLGRPGGADQSESYPAQIRAAVQAELAWAGLEALPVLADADIGHTDPILVLPYGRMAEIDCERAELSLFEAAVT